MLYNNDILYMLYNFLLDPSSLKPLLRGSR